MKIGKQFGDKIFVEWIDAYTSDKWESVDDSLNLSVNRFCYTNAFYVGKKDGFLIVCHTKGKTRDNDIMGKLYIPLKWIRRIR
uniref:Uncharacterized protein n=1 Tax=viral metagenome TaxID=1070528 RepID=A0A6M3L5Y3_9ZZZZ